MWYYRPEEPCTLSPEEEDLIQLFRQLTEEEQQCMLDSLKEKTV